MVIRNPEVVALAGLSCILTLMPLFLPLSGLFLTVVAPFPLIIMALKYPWRHVLGLLVLQGVILSYYDTLQPLLFLGQHGLVALVMAGSIRRRYSVAQTMARSVMIPLGVGGLCVVLYSLYVQQHPRVVLRHYVEQGVRVVQEYGQDLEQTQGEASEQMVAFAEAAPQFFLVLLPAIMVMNSLLTNICNYLLARRYCQHSRSACILDPADLTLWHASDHLVWVFLASGVALLLPFQAISAWGLNVFALTLVIYFLQGLAVVAFWGRRLPGPPRIRWLIGLAVFLLAGPLCIVVCIALGLFDLWGDFRRQRHHQLKR